MPQIAFRFGKRDVNLAPEKIGGWTNKSQGLSELKKLKSWTSLWQDQRSIRDDVEKCAENCRKLEWTRVDGSKIRIDTIDSFWVVIKCKENREIGQKKTLVAHN